MKKIILAFALVASIIILYIMLTSSDGCSLDAESPSGITKADITKVETDLNGRTIEQNNIINRIAEDNKPGSIKHLYIISAYSGEVLIYSTVKGKVTSSGKRLSPSQATSSTKSGYGTFEIHTKNSSFYTNEVLGDDGAYTVGSSAEYLYWWDSKGVYHQQYVTGGMILHISNQPIAVKSITLNLESENK